MPRDNNNNTPTAYIEGNFPDSNGLEIFDAKKLERASEIYLKIAKKTLQQKARLEEQIRIQSEKLEKEASEKKFKNEQEKEKWLYEQKKENLEALDNLNQDLVDKQLKASAKASQELLHPIQTSLKKFASEGLKEVYSKISNKFTNSITSYAEDYANFYSAIETNLQGSGLSFQNINDVIKKNTAGSPLLKYTSVMEELNTLIGQGIADNVTQRAFLASVSDKIATTFEVNNATLLRLVRIQRADTTAERLELEASLTRFLNENFKDTSYLHNTSDTVSQALFDVVARAGTTEGVALEGVIQRWLGSLGSLGASSSTLNQIAEAINSLGTGDISGIGSGLQNLLAISAARGGQSYSNLLTKGISAADANTLLYNLVAYVKEISASDNNVVKAQFANLFGISVSDMLAFNSISEGVINELTDSALIYSNTLEALSDDLDRVGERTHISEKISNVVDNILKTTSVSVIENPAIYAIYKLADDFQNYIGDFHIADIFTAGFGANLNISIPDLIKSSIVGINLLSQSGNILSNLFTSSNLSLDKWEVTSSGTGFGLRSPTETIGGESGKIFVTSSSPIGMAQAAQESALEEARTISGEQLKNKTADEVDFYETTLNDIREIKDAILNSISGGTLKVTVENYGLTGNMPD